MISPSEHGYCEHSLPELQLPYPDCNWSVVAGSGLEEICGVSRISCAELLAQAFLSADVAGSLHLLDGFGVLEDFFPELRANRDLFQDERWNGPITVGEHAFRAAAMVSDFLNHDKFLGLSSVLCGEEILVHPCGMHPADLNPLEQRLSAERFRILVGLAAFCHDLGKRTGMRDFYPIGDPMKRGERDVKQYGNRTDFCHVIFEGHELHGAEVFLERMGALNTCLPAKWKFSPSEIQMAADWIRHHNQWKQMVRNSPRGATPEQHAFRMYAYAYPDSRFNEGLAPDQAVWGLLLISQMELLTSEPNQYVASAPAKNWAKYQAQFEQNRAAFMQIVPATMPIVPATLQAIGTLRTTLAHRLEAPLVGGEDWNKLIIPDAPIRATIQREIANRREGGQITTRMQALRFAARCSSRSLTDSELQAIAEASGGYALTSGRLENLRIVKTVKFDGYAVREWEAQPLRQRLSREQAALFLETGNFPRILDWARRNNISNPPVVVEELLKRKKGFANILQLEAFLGLYSQDPRDLKDLHAPNMTMYEVLAQLPSGEMRRTALPFGFQAMEAHSGMGVIHVLFERMESLQAHFMKEDEALPEMQRRFLWDGVMRVAGTGELILPSNLYDDRQLLYGQISGVAGQYLSLVIDCRHGAQRVMTAIYHKDQRDLRDDLKYQIRMRAERSKAEAAEMRELSNAYLKSIGVSSVYANRRF